MKNVILFSNEAKAYYFKNSPVNNKFIAYQKEQATIITLAQCRQIINQSGEAQEKFLIIDAEPEYYAPKQEIQQTETPITRIEGFEKLIAIFEKFLTEERQHEAPPPEIIDKSIYFTIDDINDFLDNHFSGYNNDVSEFKEQFYNYRLRQAVRQVNTTNF